MATVLLRGAEVASSHEVRPADVLVRDGKIVAVGDLSGTTAAQEIDLSGLTLMPGVIDTQVHFREPGGEHKEDIATGSEAAIAGGVTTYFEMPNTSPTTTTEAALADKLSRARGRSHANYAFFVGATADNVGDLARLENLPGTPGVKIFMGSSTGSLLVPDDETLRAVLLAGRKPCPIHAEDHERLESRKALLDPDLGPSQHPYLRDEECARRATERILRLCEETGRPVHVLHISTRDELPLLAEAKRKGLPVTCEATPHHLTLAAPECYDQLGTFAQMNPPVRSAEHRDALWEAVRAGLFDVFGSDHAPHTREEKSVPYPGSPSGMPGVQTLLPVLLDHVAHGRLGLTDLVRMACENPTRLYGIQGKGFLQPGFDADLCAVDLRATRAVEASWLRSKCGWSPYEGMSLTGWPVHVWIHGEFAVRDGELVGQPRGRVVEFA